MHTEWWKKVRKDDPKTSRIAAQTLNNMEANHHARILYALRKYGPLIAHEIADATGLDHVQVCRRLPELEDDDLVFDTGETRKSPSGRPARVWSVYENSSRL